MDGPLYLTGDPKGLNSPADIVVGKTYRILGSFGKDEVGECIAKNEGSFGQAWGTIKTPVGEFPTRYQLLELVEE